MTSRSPGIAFAPLFALALAAALSSWACLSAPCNCPYGGGFVNVTVPAAQSSPIVSATTDPACTVAAGTDAVSVMTGYVGTCQVRVTLTNGDTYAFSVAFSAMVIGNDCKCTVLRTDVSAPQLVAGGDGGTD